MWRTTSAFHVAVVAATVLLRDTPGAAADADRGLPPHESGRLTVALARWLSASVRDLDTGRASLQKTIRSYPPPPPQPQTTRFGFQSRLFPTPSNPSSVTLDLGRSRAVDAIVLVPAYVDSGGRAGTGYGFPRRFRVQVSDGPAFEDAIVVADYTGHEAPNPGLYPFVVRTPGIRAQYVRVTSTEHQKQPDGYLWALSEIMVLSGPRNVAAGATVWVASEESVNSPPHWSHMYLVDGVSILGLPVSSEPSPSDGYSSPRGSAAGAKRWVQVDLGSRYPIEEIRLIPARPTNEADIAGWGFPQKFKVQAGDDARFETTVDVLDHTGRYFSNPGANPVVVGADGVQARFVRVTATVLPPGAQRTFALGELQVYSGGRNVALGAEVSFLDRLDDPRFPRWAPEHLVDGFASRNRLIELPAWLDALSQRSRLESRLATVAIERQAAIDRAVTRLVALSTATTFGLGGVLIATLVRHRRSRRRETERLRRQIASDLHDSTGSLLGSIALISQMAREDVSGAAKADFEEIERIARESIDSMHDSIWLISPGSSPRRDLVTKMRQVASRALADKEYTLTVVAPGPDVDLDLDLRRHVLLAFKETIANVASHADARVVQIEIQDDERSFRFTVRDDGRGFDPKAEPEGHGLPSLGRRAEALGGQVQIQSAPGAGTEVRFNAPTRPSPRDTVASPWIRWKRSRFG